MAGETQATGGGSAPQNAFRDMKIDGLCGYPEVVATDSNTFFISDWSGYIRKVDWSEQSVKKSPSTAIMNGLGGASLRSLCATQTGNLAAVATTAGWAAVWNLDSGIMEKIHSKFESPVFSACLSSNGETLVLGTGKFALSGPVPEAAIEIWSFQDGWQFSERVALPGVCVEWIGYDKCLDSMSVISGRLSQGSGFISFLSLSGLVSYKVVELDSVMGHVLSMNEDPWAVWFTGDGSTLEFINGNPHEDYRLDDWSIDDIQDDLKGACVDRYERELLTNAGRIYDCSSYSKNKLLDGIFPLPNCYRVIMRPDGGYIGITRDGVLRVWDSRH